MPVPAGFISSRRREELRQAQERERAKENALLELHVTYEKWIDGRTAEELDRQYPGPELHRKLEEIVKGKRGT